MKPIDLTSQPSSNDCYSTTLIIITLSIRTFQQSIYLTSSFYHKSNSSDQFGTQVNRNQTSTNRNDFYQEVLILRILSPAGLDRHFPPHIAAQPGSGPRRFHRLLHAHRHLQDAAVRKLAFHLLLRFYPQKKFNQMCQQLLSLFCVLDQSIPF